MSGWQLAGRLVDIDSQSISNSMYFKAIRWILVGWLKYLTCSILKLCFIAFYFSRFAIITTEAGYCCNKVACLKRIGENSQTKNNNCIPSSIRFVAKTNEKPS